MVGLRCLEGHLCCGPETGQKGGGAAKGQAASAKPGRCWCASGGGGDGKAGLVMRALEGRANKIW